MLIYVRDRSDMVGMRHAVIDLCRRAGELRRFALAFIHSHSGATGVFRNAFREFVG